jgi:hypothetical protein
LHLTSEIDIVNQREEYPWKNGNRGNAIVDDTIREGGWLESALESRSIELMIACDSTATDTSERTMIDFSKCVTQISTAIAIRGEQAQPKEDVEDFAHFGRGGNTVGERQIECTVLCLV